MFSKQSYEETYFICVHEKRKPFKLWILLPKLFSIFLSNIHIASIHDDKKSLKCEFCGITYSGKSNLNTHTALVHEKKFKCIFCYISGSQKGRDSAYMYSIHKYKPSSYIDLRRTRDRFDVHMKLSLLLYCV